MWAAYYQEDGALRHTIAVKKLCHQAEWAANEFIDRMTYPGVGLWWVWVEATDAAETNEENDVTL